jgi:CRP-like cAMP-binding protein
VYIVEQGEPASELYLILSGEVEVHQDAPDGTRHMLGTHGPGEFFGELAIAHTTGRMANVIARDAVTCMVFSRGAATAWAGRGDVSELEGVQQVAAEPDVPVNATTVVDVSGQIGKKIAAIAAHRTQYPIEPEMFPTWMLTEMIGREYFVRVHPPVEPEHDLFG